MIGEVKILKPGFCTTIQDKGRFGFSKFGIPKSGAMDQMSYNFANLLLDNDEDDACIEWVLQPPVLQFLRPTIISLTGASVDAFLNDKPVEMYHQIRVFKNDVLNFSFCKNKMYGYVGVKSGFLTPIAFGSRSYYKSITNDYILRVNEYLEYYSTVKYREQFSTISAPMDDSNSGELSVYKGADFDTLSASQKSMLINSSFTVSKTISRMAIQLEEKIPNSIASILTSPVLPGTVQLTPSGALIVLMRDCQTTGGYPRVLQLTESAINSIAQMRMGEKINFRIVN
ncbi:biotin-dependent carboxyltransferase family protein [Aquimarina longa]|uniref:5-oxoprolinase subunit C family protein n=1 Tax=Aquimarina longa TaxID=1080221 RepID=UPI0007842B0A|nr:biotin-dependent carboxyltransferase family protein [Aquimarina longa]